MSKPESSTSGLSIDRLLGRENYPTWKFAAQAYLDLDNLWTTTIDYEVDEEGNPKTPIKPDQDRRARSKLTLIIDPLCYVHIQNAKTAKELWQQLANAYEDSGLTRRVALLRKLITTTLSNCNSMDIYVKEIVTTAQSLNGIGFPISEEWIGSLLLAGLPESYRPMIMALENSGISISGDSIKIKLLQDVPNACENSAFHTANRQIPPRTNRKGPKCKKCHNFGHIAKYCRTKTQQTDNHREKRYDAFSAVALSTLGTTNINDWYFDSAATSHMTLNSNLLNNMHAEGGIVATANKSTMQIEASGNTTFRPDCKDSLIEINNVQYVPEISTNLLSVSQIVKRGHKVVFKNSGVEVINPDGEIISTGSHINGLFKLNCSAIAQNKAFSCSSVASLQLWHRRMGHLNHKSLQKLQNELSTGIQFSTTNTNDCKICPIGKQIRLPFNKNATRASHILELVHSDICGPMEEESLGGKRYFLTLIDDKTRKIFVYFLKTKSEIEVSNVFKDFLCFAEKQSGHSLKTLRTDNGKEYLNKTFQQIIKRNGINHQTTNVHTPEQNGVAERNNRSIVEKARCMLYDANLPKAFWAEAVAYSVYLLNRSPSKGTGITPEEAWSGRKPDLSHIKVFGTVSMVHIPKTNRKKWDPKAQECIMTGFDEQTKGYRLYDVNKKIIFKSRNVSFIDENSSVAECPTKSILKTKHNKISLELNHIDDTYIGEENTNQQNISQPNTLNKQDRTKKSADVKNQPDLSTLRRSERNRQKPAKLDDFVTETESISSSDEYNSAEPTEEISSSAAEDDFHGFSEAAAPPSHQNRPDCLIQQVSKLSVEGRNYTGKYSYNSLPSQSNTARNLFQSFTQDPVTLEEALSHPDSDKWKLAMEEEYQSLMENHTWSLQDLPPNRRAIKCKWVFRTKRDITGSIDRYKARLVIKGYSQRKGVDYEETYSPVVRHSSLRYLFAIAAQMNLKIEQMDAVTAFLQGRLEDEIYMEQPPLYVEQNDQSKVCRLNKALYGLKQSSRIWNQELNNALESFGLRKSKYDSCLFYKVENNKLLITAVYVDDILLFCNDDNWLKNIKDFLNQKFQMKDLGAATHILGMRITRGENFIALDQELYIQNILEKFGMENAKPVTTPMNASEKISKNDCATTNEDIQNMQNIPYQEAVGCLMYLSQCTRPDICFAVNKLSRYNANPGLRHWSAVKHLFRYLRGTSNLKLYYTSMNDITKCNVIGYTDADWASNLEDRKSTTGYVFIAQGGAISWCSKRQQTVALSSCEAEYIALSATVQEAIWWNGIRSHFYKNDQPLNICCDNQSAISIASGGGFHPKAKHIDIRHHFIQDTLSKGEFKLTYVSTDQQVADVLTKPLDRTKFEKFREALGIQ